MTSVDQLQGPSRGTIRVMIAAASLMRLGVQALLESDRRVSVLDEAGSWRDLFLLLDGQSGCPDLVMLDPALPGLTFAAGLQRLREGCPETRTLRLSSDWSGTDLSIAIRAAVSQRTPRPEPGRRVAHTLSQREMDVLRLMAHGQTNPQIAAQLGVTPNTVKMHVSSILIKLGVKHRTAAAVRALELLQPQ
jgi:DNA-binding NarL/FixJ family response regulator